ncbi:MAG: hypothetical protein ABIQ32_04525 [Sphingomicrobium sp.]
MDVKTASLSILAASYEGAFLLAAVEAADVATNRKSKNRSIVEASLILVRAATSSSS